MTIIVQQNLDNTLSIIQGDWKYIEPSDKPALEYWTKIEMGNAPQPQLYNLSIDPSEKDNVAEAHPDKVKNALCPTGRGEGSKEPK